MQWQFLWPATKLPNRPKGQVRFQNTPRGTDPLVIPGGIYAHSKKSRGFFWRCRCKCYHIALTVAKSTATARAYGHATAV